MLKAHLSRDAEGAAILAKVSAEAKAHEARQDRAVEGPVRNGHDQPEETPWRGIDMAWIERHLPRRSISELRSMLKRGTAGIGRRSAARRGSDREHRVAWSAQPGLSLSAGGFGDGRRRRRQGAARPGHVSIARVRAMSSGCRVCSSSRATGTAGRSLATHGEGGAGGDGGKSMGRARGIGRARGSERSDGALRATRRALVARELAAAR